MIVFTNKNPVYKQYIYGGDRMKTIKLVHFDKESVEDVPIERITSPLKA